MKRKMITKATDDGITFVFSTNDVDRDGDRVLQDWDLADFEKNPIALAFHRSDQPIGMWKNMRVEAGKLLGDLQLAARGTSDFIDTLHSLVEQNILKAVSVGFRSNKAEPNDFGGFDLSKNYLFECSLVSVPANQNALRKAFDFMPEEELDEMCAVSGNCSVEPTEGQDSKRVSEAVTNKKQLKGSTMTIAERIKLLQDQIVAAKDGMTALTSAEEVDNEAIDAASATIEDLEKSLDTFQKAESAMAIKSVVVAEKAPKPGVVKGEIVERSKGELSIKAFVALAKAHVAQTSPQAMVKSIYGGAKDIDVMVKAITNPADTTTDGWASQLVEEGTGGFLDLLMPETVYGRVPGLSLDFGKYGSVVVPAWDSTRSLPGTFVAEGAPIPVKEGLFTSRTMTPKKMAVISTFTQEILNKSTPAIESLVRTAMIQDTTVAIDTAFLDDTAASTTRPAGLQNATATGADNINASTGATVTDILADVKGVMSRLADVQLGNSGVWIMNPTVVYGLATKQLATGQFAFPEVGNGSFMGFPIVQSTTVPADVVFYVDAQALVKATDRSPEFTVSNQATLVMADPADPIVDSGSATTNDVRSLYQTDSVGLRLILGLDWSIQRAGGVQVLTGVAW